MQSTIFSSHNLLQYNPTYRILICRDCQYAIQKNALESHLLRHKIYRKDRQSLLDSISELDLVEPDDVEVPPTDTPPIDGLPVLDGLRCSSSWCNYLCSSSKRMRAHWSDAHGPEECGNVPALAKEIKMQTFFKGTKIRYFEVTIPAETAGVTPSLHTSKSHVDNEETEGEPMEVEDTPTSEQPRKDSSSKHTQGTGPTNVDLITLTYFHQFITSTSLKLPESISRPLYWKNDVLCKGLYCHFIMCGLLALSAYHLASLQDDIAERQTHLDHSIEYYPAFHAGMDSLDSEAEARSSSLTASIRKFSAKNKCMLHCAYFGLAKPEIDRHIFSGDTSSSLGSLFSSLRSYNTRTTSSTPRSTATDSIDGESSAVFAEARKVMTVSRLLSELPVQTSEYSTQYARFTALTRLDELPARMTGMRIFERPQTEPLLHEVMVVLEAIAVLITACGVGFASDDMETVWSGVTTWAEKVPDEFIDMVDRGNLAALVVMSYWAEFLVARAERFGCWFLKGVKGRVIRTIIETISEGEGEVLALIEEIL